MSKIKFEREAMGTRVTVDSYFTDNGIYTSKNFTRELHGKVQGISHSVVGGSHSNGVLENAINNVVIISRNMMIHYELIWSDSINNSLWPMSMAIMFTYTTILPKYILACLQRKFGQGPIPLIFPYIIHIHGGALNMSWNQDFRMGKSCLGGCQGIGEINVWEHLFCIPEQ